MDEEFIMSIKIDVHDLLPDHEDHCEISHRAETPDPVFLVGSRRSGSTLFRLMLGSHPDVAFRRHAEIEHAFRLMSPSEGLPSDLTAYFSALEGDYECVQSGLKVDRSLPLDELLNKFWDESVRNDEAALNMGTVHSNFSLIPRVWPKARFIYLYRDGRDVARSRINLDWEGTYWSAIRKWIDSEQEWAAMKPGLNPGSYLEVRYEDLVLETKPTLQKVCAFLDIPFSSDFFNYTETSSYKKPDPNLVGQWRKDATDLDIRSAEARAGQYLKVRGYEMSGLPPMQVDRNQARKFDRKGVWKRRYRRVRFQGLKNYVLEVASRRIGLSRIHASVSLAIDKRRRDWIA